MINISTGPRIPYEKRTNWMAEVHYQYGRRCHLHDIDPIEMWIEHTSGELAALAEFKNENELIETYKYKQLISLANNSKIPCYIVVGYQYGDAGGVRPAYHIIPLNDICKKILEGSAGKWMSEVSYIKFLHSLRKLPMQESDFANKGQQYADNLPLPNLK